MDQADLDKLCKTFMTLCGIIIVLGLMMVLSSSYIYSRDIYGSPVYIFGKQAAFLVMGLMIAFIVSKTRMTFWLKYGPWFTGLLALTLALTLVTRFGVEAKGAQRWVGVGAVRFQPGEFLKYFLIFTAIPYFEKYALLEKKEAIWKGLLLLAPVLLILCQPDFGTFTICIVVLLYICFLSSFPRKHFFLLLASGLISGGFIVMLKPYRVKRLLTFLDPWKNPKGSGFQIIQSFMGFANGGLWGQGLGNSNEKLFYLPEAHNDFILSVIGEEMGVFGVVTIMVLFFLFLVIGVKLALALSEKFAQMMVLGVTFTIAFQGFVNMAVVLGLLPTKGLNLPMISYGGSSLISTLFGIGLIFSAVKSEQKRREVFNHDPIGQSPYVSKLPR